jgi:hypothetical protein
MLSDASILLLSSNIQFTNGTFQVQKWGSDCAEAVLDQVVAHCCPNADMYAQVSFGAHFMRSADTGNTTFFLGKGLTASVRIRPSSLSSPTQVLLEGTSDPMTGGSSVYHHRWRISRTNQGATCAVLPTPSILGAYASELNSTAKYSVTYASALTEGFQTVTCMLAHMETGAFSCNQTHGQRFQ